MPRPEPRIQPVADLPGEVAARAIGALNRLPRGAPGTQTQGRWLGPGADTSVVKSGISDQWYAAARAAAFRFRGAERGRMLSLATHVEVKMATRMTPGQDETIVIDRAVCGRTYYDRHKPATCDRYLHKFLPPGATLTVVEHDGTAVTYQGEDP